MNLFPIRDASFVLAGLKLDSITLKLCFIYISFVFMNPNLIRPASFSMLIALPLLAAHHWEKREVLNSILHCSQMPGLKLGRLNALNLL